MINAVQLQHNGEQMSRTVLPEVHGKLDGDDVNCRYFAEVHSLRHLRVQGFTTINTESSAKSMSLQQIQCESPSSYLVVITIAGASTQPKAYVSGCNGRGLLLLKARTCDLDRTMI